MEPKFERPYRLCADMGQRIRQPEGPRRKQVFNQQSVAILLDDHNRSERIQSEGLSRLTRQMK